MEGKPSSTDPITRKSKYHPYQNAGFFSKAFYFWMWPLFRLGLKKDLTQDDLHPPLATHDSQIQGNKLEASWNYELETKKQASLWTTLLRVYWKDLVYTAFLFIITEAFIKPVQPLCMSRFLEYYRPESTMSPSEVYTYAALIVLIQFFQVVLSHYYLIQILQLGLKMRMAISSLMYRKALKLSLSSLAETTIGQMVNLLSNDLSRFDTAVVQFHCLWFCPIQALIVMILCYINLGLAAMIGVILLILFIPFQLWIAKRVSVYRQRTATRTDERIRLMNEIISGIQVIKMYTWEKPFAKLVELSRRKELVQIRNISFIRATIGSLNLILNRCAIYSCLVAFVVMGNIPTAQYVYTLTTFYNLLRTAITIWFPQGITQLAEVSVAIKRLHRFLMFEEVQREVQAEDSDKTSKKDIVQEKLGVDIRQASAKWTKTQMENTLQDIDLEVHPSQLVAVVGPVGSGKTTLLNLVLKELLLVKGSCNVKGTISYASQEPWLFVGSVRQNITFGQDFNLKRYQEVVKVCALERDFALFPFGDKTIAGERGVTLSGGQKARINLARAIYKEADIYLLDDPLSAVDAHVGRHIFDECISGYLKNKTVILVTHQLQYLRSVSKIYLLENGRIQASGTYEELQKSDNEFTKLLHDLEEQENEEKQVHSDIKKQDTRDENVDAPKMQEEHRSFGNIGWKVYKSYFVSGGHWCKIIALLLAFIISQVAGTLTDYFQSLWVNIEQERAVKENRNITQVDETDDVYLTFWDTFFTEQNCLYIYSTLIGLTIILTLSRSFAFFMFTVKASLRLHNNMFNKIVYATMKFFHSNPSGRILNRFSSDMGAIDEQLPLILLDTVQIAIMVASTMILIGSLNPWMFLPTVILFIIFYILRIIYLKTSRDVKRLDGTSKSPVYSHLNASLQGLTTIRAFGAQEVLQREFENYLNLNGAAWFTFIGCARSFGLWLDLHCVAYVALVTISFLFLKSEIFGGNVGLAITQSLNLAGIFQWGMRQWSELENRMTCVERVKEYADVTPESDQGNAEPPQSWPENGDIRFEKLSLKYDVDEPYILKDLSFTIRSTEKVGIVGRTGAGKSSIIAALFRLAITDGKIIIDDIDSKSITLNKLRSSISIIPQEPVLFSGTLRKNLDPFDAYSDEILWNSLEEVELKGVVSDLPQGLETHMSEGGSNFSVGQRQLVCLARAIVRNNKILILDEATANVDPQTDALIQCAIRKKFSDCTVLTIAHRLHTIMDCDKVLVMDAGKAVEFGHPHELLEKEGMFFSLVKQTGKATMDNLITVAKKSYEEHKLKSL